MFKLNKYHVFLYLPHGFVAVSYILHPGSVAQMVTQLGVLDGNHSKLGKLRSASFCYLRSSITKWLFRQNHIFFHQTPELEVKIPSGFHQPGRISTETPFSQDPSGIGTTVHRQQQQPVPWRSSGTHWSTYHLPSSWPCRKDSRLFWTVNITLWGFYLDCHAGV